MKKLIFLLLVCIGFISCKTPQKSIYSSKSKMETNFNNATSHKEKLHESEVMDQIIKALINEHLRIRVNQTKYDTNKPIVEETGKHPILEEVEIDITKQTEVYKVDSSYKNVYGLLITELNDNSKITTLKTGETEMEKEIGLNKIQKLLMTIGLITILGLAVFFISKSKKHPS